MFRSKHPRGALAVVLPCLVLQFHSSVSAQCPSPLYPLNEQAKLRASDGSADAHFGIAAALSGDTAIVGAEDADGTSLAEGAAYVYVRAGTVWTEQARLSASDAAADDKFGFGVAIDGDTAVVGADYKNGEAGAAYVFIRSGGVWTEQAKLTASDSHAFHHFGRSVAIQGDTAVVGATDIGVGPGAVYVFTRSGTVWTQADKLIASDGVLDDRFGRVVDIEGDDLIIGAFGTDQAGQRTGSAYVFVRSAGIWSEQAKLTAADPDAEDLFAFGVSIDGDQAVVGSRRDDDACPADPDCNSGSAYVFTRSGTVWTQEAKLTAVDQTIGDEFGTFVSIKGNLLVVGAHFDNDAGNNSGSAYVFSRSGGAWSQQAKLTASDAKIGDYFGYSLDFANGTALIGSFLDDANGTDSGSAYVFTGLADCNSNGVLDHCDIANDPNWDCDCDDVIDDCLGGPPALCTNDCNSNQIPDCRELLNGTSSDCNSNGAPDECDIATGSSLDCNTNGIPDECDADCNSNGVPDACDIAGGSADCNTNNIPDECDPDCDSDGTPDTCETNPDEQDCDENGVCDGPQIAACQPGDPSCVDADSNGVLDWCEACTAVGVRSCRNHNGTECCLDVSTLTEPRLGGIQKLEIDVDRPIAFSGEVTVNCTNAGDVSGSVTGTSIAGSTVSVTFSPPIVDDTCTVTLSCNASVCVSSVQGDLDGDGRTTTGDAAITKPHFTHTVCDGGGHGSDTDARRDFNVDGTVTTSDFSQLKPQFNNTAPACP